MIQWAGDLLDWMESSLPELGEEYGPWLVQKLHPDAVTACVRVDVEDISTEFVLSAIPLDELTPVPEFTRGHDPAELLWAPTGQGCCRITAYRTGYASPSRVADAAETTIA